MIRRWCQGYRLVALLLVLLAASPFTAPFSTCDDAILAVHDGAAFDHDSEKTLDTAALWHTTMVVPMSPAWSMAVVRSLDGIISNPGPSLFSLRL